MSEGLIMQRVKNCTIRKESFEDMLRAGRINHSLEIPFQDGERMPAHRISDGYDDGISIYQENGETYVLSQNPRLDYVSLEVFEGGKRAANLFILRNGMITVPGRRRLSNKTKIQRSASTFISSCN